jgi:hypothetical protein
MGNRLRTRVPVDLIVPHLSSLGDIYVRKDFPRKFSEAYPEHLALLVLGPTRVPAINGCRKPSDGSCYFQTEAIESNLTNIWRQWFPE